MKGAADLVKLVEQFRLEHPDLDQHANSMLGRLISEDWETRVVRAFNVVPIAKRPIFLADCIRAELEARTHKQVVKCAQKKIAEAPKKISEFWRIAGFLGRGPSLTPDPLDLRVPIDSRDALDEALQLIRVSIENEQRDSERILKEHSRKTTDEAARASGIGWIADSMRKLTGKPRIELVADLATVVLNSEDITAAAVRKALTPRQQLKRGRHSNNVVHEVWLISEPLADGSISIKTEKKETRHRGS